MIPKQKQDEKLSLAPEDEEGEEGSSSRDHFMAAATQHINLSLAFTSHLSRAGITHRGAAAARQVKPSVGRGPCRFLGPPAPLSPAGRGPEGA